MVTARPAAEAVLLAGATTYIRFNLILRSVIAEIRNTDDRLVLVAQMIGMPPFELSNG